jgi:protein involved in ribonucleotide reduction
MNSNDFSFVLFDFILSFIYIHRLFKLNAWQINVHTRFIEVNDPFIAVAPTSESTSSAQVEPRKKRRIIIEEEEEEL